MEKQISVYNKVQDEIIKSGLYNTTGDFTVVFHDFLTETITSYLVSHLLSFIVNHEIDCKTI